MTEPHDDLAGALHELRGEIRDVVPVPEADSLRARASHQLRVRRAATAVVAAAAVVAVALGGNTLLRPTAGPPAPPVDSPRPSVVPSPEPSRPPVTPSPRPVPVTPEPLDDPITEVDWRNATITLPPKDGCPDGPVSFIAVSDIFPNALGPADGFPKIMLSATNAAYGDLTGDGRAEAVVEASCATSEEGLNNGDGGQLLVVAREDDGTLVGLDWVGPSGAAYLSYWIIGGRLLIDADPGPVGAADYFPRVPGLALAYQWDGNGFAGWEPAAEYPPIVPLQPGQTGPPVRLRAVAGGLRCQDAELRMWRSASGSGGAQTGDGSLYSVPAMPGQQYLFDLDNTGDRLLVTALTCVTANRATRYGLAVFERAGEGWQGISVLVSPDGHEPGAWRAEGEEVIVDWQEPHGGDEARPVSYRWNGTELIPMDE
jgi:hypothetical protein